MSICTRARSSIGPRQATTWSRRGLSMPIEITETPDAVGTGMIRSSTWVGPRVGDAEHRGDRVAVDVGVDDADLEARAAIASARLTVTEDLPTPPLPLAIANTLVSEPGWAKGISRWAWPPRRFSCRPARCSAVITPSSRSTPVTPATPRRRR